MRDTTEDSYLVLDGVHIRHGKGDPFQRWMLDLGKFSAGLLLLLLNSAVLFSHDWPSKQLLSSCSVSYQND